MSPTLIVFINLIHYETTFAYQFNGGGTWFGLFAPAKTPRHVIERINAEAVSALNSPELIKAFGDKGIVASAQTPEEFGRFVQQEVNKWKDLAAKVSIVAE